MPHGLTGVHIISLHFKSFIKSIKDVGFETVYPNFTLLQKEIYLLFSMHSLLASIAEMPHEDKAIFDSHDNLNKAIFRTRRWALTPRCDYTTSQSGACQAYLWGRL